MSKKVLVAYLLLIVIMILWVLPISVLGETQVFKPRLDVNWTGFTELESTLGGIKFWYKRPGNPFVGYYEGLNNAGKFRRHQYRGFAIFDIAALPANACVSKIEVIGKSLTASPGHSLVVQRLQRDPLTESAQALHDGIRNGQIYISCSGCMSSTGEKTINLPFSSYAHLESAQSQGWFALGFTEFNEDNLPGMWEGIIPPVQTTYPALRVTYTAPPSATPVPAISVDSVCVGNQFCITWNSIPGATSYEIRDGYWTNVGNVTSKCYTAGGVGDYTNTYYVRAANSCGAGSSSLPVSIRVITAPVQPTTPVTGAPSYCLNTSYTISWTSLAGADTYEIREDNNSWINVGNTTQWTFTPSLAGVHSYEVRGVNMCGPGTASSPAHVSVIAAPSTPNPPRISVDSVCTNVQYCVTWNQIPNATSFEIKENALAWQDLGYALHKCYTKGVASDFSYQIRAKNSCGTSPTSASATVVVSDILIAPAQPVASNGPHCANVDYSISWASLVGADTYEIQEDLGRWINTGTKRKWIFNHTSRGSHSYIVRGVNACGSGRSSRSTFVAILSVPATQAQPIVSSASVCKNENFTLSWFNVGADSYQIKRDNGVWLNANDGGLQEVLSIANAGNYKYYVRGLNVCGNGNSSPSVTVSVAETMVAPIAPIASNTNPCPGDNVTISWAAVAGTTNYKLTDAIAGRDVYTGQNLSWTGPHPLGSFEYHVAVTDGCGWSNASGPLFVNVKRELFTPRAPISDQNPAFLDEPYIISWESVRDATDYELYEDGKLAYRGAEPATRLSKSEPGEFTYSVKACDNCGCSNMGDRLLLSVGQQTAVEEIDGANLPDDYALAQNYPNPFNPETRIDFSLKRAGHVKLTIYNVLGEIKRILVNDYLSAGYKSVFWDGRDNYGQQVSSGIYLYKLTASEYTEIKKMMLVK